MIPGLPTPLSLCLDAGDADDTFYSQRVYDLFPQLATANSGWNTHTADGSQVFGSVVQSGATNNSDYMEWTVKVPAGNYKVRFIYVKHTNRGIVSLRVNGGSLFDSCDQYDAVGNIKNQIFTSSEFALSEGSNTIRLEKNGKNASSSSYVLAVSHVQLVKQNAGSALVLPSNAPVIIDIPIVFADSHTNWNTLGWDTNFPFGIYLVSSGAQNDAITYSFWAPKGTYTLAFLHYRFTNRGIATVTVDGSSIGTVDQYGTPDFGILNTSLSGTLAYTGIHTLTFTMASKNASASAYYGQFHHIQIRMTSVTEPASQDLAPEIALLWPMFAEANSDWGVIDGLPNMAYYYRRYNNSPSLGDSLTLSSNVVALPGTYRFDGIFQREISCGIIHVIIDGVDVGQIDTYHTGTGYNYAGSVSGIVLSGTSPHTVILRMDSKNASSSNYYGIVTLARLVRTGA